MGTLDYCPLYKATELLGERWTPLIMRQMLCGGHRFNDLRRALPRISPSLLSRRLRALERHGILTRRLGPHGAPEYWLTQAGHELRPIIERMGAWGERWAQSDLSRRDPDGGISR